MTNQYISYTLVDITNNLNTKNIAAYNQKQNLNTFIQLAGLRSQPISFIVTCLKAQDLADYRFGSSYSGQHGQKTGFFLDQRENRALLAAHAKDKKILNVFSYTGGFSISALVAGATEVHSLDSSARALEVCEQNVALNGLDPKKHQCIQSDALEYLKSDELSHYDIVVLDPPAFAKRASARHAAVQGYKRINLRALQSMKPGSLLFTFSCSQAVDDALFTNTLVAAAIQAGRNVRILHRLHQPPDHPVNVFHPEGSYLKGLVLRVD